MKNLLTARGVSVMLMVILLPVNICLSQENSKGEFLGKADMYKAKQTAFDYLGESQVVEKYGRISDQIWSFAELGLQEFRSSRHY